MPRLSCVPHPARDRWTPIAWRASALARMTLAAVVSAAWMKLCAAPSSWPRPLPTGHHSVRLFELLGAASAFVAAAALPTAAHQSMAGRHRKRPVVGAAFTIVAVVFVLAWLYPRFAMLAVL